MTGADEGHETRKIRFRLPAVGLACRDDAMLWKRVHSSDELRVQEFCFLVLLLLLLPAYRLRPLQTHVGLGGGVFGGEGDGGGSLNSLKEQHWRLEHD